MPLFQYMIRDIRAAATTSYTVWPELDEFNAPYLKDLHAALHVFSDTKPDDPVGL